MVLPQPDPKEEIIYLSNSNSQTNVSIVYNHFKLK